MSLSMQRAIDLMNEKKEDIDYNDLVFFLTVLRDNAKDDYVHETLIPIVDYLHTRFKDLADQANRIATAKAEVVKRERKRTVETLLGAGLSLEQIEKQMGFNPKDYV